MFYVAVASVYFPPTFFFTNDAPEMTMATVDPPIATKTAKSITANSFISIDNQLASSFSFIGASFKSNDFATSWSNDPFHFFFCTTTSKAVNVSVSTRRNR